MATAERNKQKRFDKGAVGLAVVILLIFVIISGVIAVNIALPTSSGVTSDAVINLAENAPKYNASAQSSGVSLESSDSSGSDSSGSDSSGSDSSGSDSSDTLSADDSSDSGGLTVFDSDVVWSTNTLVNIFEHNDSAVESDGSGDANNVVAPGTTNSYEFTLQNNQKYAVTYTMEISGADDSSEELPVLIQVVDSEGNSLSGDWKRIGEFTDISEINSLSPYTDKQYAVNWKWDYETGTDDYDTYLGDKAVDEELACHIDISVVSAYDYSVAPADDDSASGSSNFDITKIITGENGIAIVIIAVFLICALTVILLLRRKNSSTSGDGGND